MDAELAEKRRRLLELLRRRDLDALVLRRPANVSWYSGGGRAHVLAMQAVAAAAIVVRPDGDEVVSPVNEAARLADEELHRLGATFIPVGWDTDVDAAVPGGSRVGSDLPAGGSIDMSSDVEAARRSLTPAELERYRVLGRESAEALTDVCGALQASSTEHAAAARVAAALVECGIDPIVLLVAGAERLPVHRHPLPTRAPLGGLAMVVVCARRSGLIASLTRFVSFGSPAAETVDRYERIARVDAAFNATTVPGARVRDVFAAGLAAYEEQGFGSEEWRLHHQGGPTGYEPRDYLATAAAEARVEPEQAFAWNPSAPSVKVEDTVLAREGRPEILTVDGRWPILRVGGLARPAILER